MSHEFDDYTPLRLLPDSYDVPGESLDQLQSPSHIIDDTLDCTTWPLPTPLSFEDVGVRLDGPSELLPVTVSTGGVFYNNSSGPYEEAYAPERKKKRGRSKPYTKPKTSPRRVAAMKKRRDDVKDEVKTMRSLGVEGGTQLDVLRSARQVVAEVKSLKDRLRMPTSTPINEVAAIAVTELEAARGQLAAAVGEMEAVKKQLVAVLGLSTPALDSATLGQVSEIAVRRLTRTGDNPFGPLDLSTPHFSFNPFSPE